jgi:glucose/arabinose dehydrogenase
MVPGAPRRGRWFAIWLSLLLIGCGSAQHTPPGTEGATPSAGTATASASAATATASVAPATSPASPASTAPLKLELEVIVGGLAEPTDVADPGDGSHRRFVVEQAGRIRIVAGSRLRARPFLDITAEVKSGGEQGLLGLAFHPDFPTDPRFFVDYTDVDGNTVVSEYRLNSADADAADPASERPLVHIDQPYANHNGGGLAFGPDGLLYVATGDGGSGGDPQGNGQRTDTLLAKILRIDVDRRDAARGLAYGIPADNPFLDVPGALPEIWLTGLRNPWRFRFDPANGDMWIGDVGQNAWEEVDVARAGTGGLNFGWNRMEGFHCYEPSKGCDRTGLTLPVAEYGHDRGCAIIGGVVVRGSGQPGLDGWYVFSDSCSGNLWLLDPAGDGRREPDLAGQWSGSISSIAQADDGTVLATDLQSGQLLAFQAVQS